MDAPDRAAFRELEAPFWLAGSNASPEKLAEARASGAQGVQLGSAFAFTEESAIAEDIKRDVLKRARTRSLQASPISKRRPRLPVQDRVREETSLPTCAQGRVCDLGYLRQRISRATLIGTVSGRASINLREEGGRKRTRPTSFACATILATIDLGQERPPVRSSAAHAGADLAEIARFVAREPIGIRGDVLSYMEARRERASDDSARPEPVGTVFEVREVGEGGRGRRKAARASCFAGRPYEA